MNINLTYSRETEKAFLTNEFGWMPKKAAPLACNGQIHQIADWFAKKNPEMVALAEKQRKGSEEFWANPENQDGYKAWRKSGLTLSQFKAVHH